jgi:hypothetical protein
MADDKIDPALVQLSRQYPRQIFIQKGAPSYGVQWTSTCTDQPARWPIHTETQWTPMLRTAIAEEYAKQLQAQAGSTTRYYQKEIVGRIGSLFGRERTTVTNVITTIRKST